MEKILHLLVEKGEEKGMRFSIPPGGARLGRSSKNDIVLVDPILSRHHCRFFFKPEEGLYVTDLGSANCTLVNNKPIQEVRLRVDDTICVGDTVLRVLDDGSAAAKEVDLGFTPRERAKDAQGRRIGLGPLLLLVLLAALAVVGAYAIKEILTRETRPLPAPPGVAAPLRHTLEVEYEKVEANADNVFRYLLTIDRDGVISVQIDDVANERHVRKEERMDAAYLQNLAAEILGTGFFTLEDEYIGIQPDVLQTWDLSITIDRRTHRSRVVNRVEPPIFRLVRERLEEGGKNELGLWAIQFSREKLLEMAAASYQLGCKLYDEREVKLGNLADAIQSFTEADWYLETVEPKPAFYPDILSGMTDARKELDRRHDERIFRAERAIMLEDWSAAARELQDICAMIPKRSDPRHEEARKKLLDVENHLDVKR